ncbi:GNAT family N-acetyltransferase [Chelatococcus sp. SYSU_G07232]|uniref:GNAT family N-acetyltransferase n=1 Tax=Chelatococcus albus TaxID=3047466 RepID=A0ABT7ABC8_9HYPH|nr:GNAT family N-acetyltransferase [Chelatococcus sp. SYSU_G07232]MDJ1156675.1 GNAT family N-acetyltransferase [Chelatococcus sp. SYSU_G07232]
MSMTRAVTKPDGPRATAPSADVLVAAHLRMLSGSYLPEVVAGPGRAIYAWSAHVPDVTMNFAVRLGPSDVGWLVRMARERARAPALLAADEAAARIGEAERATVYPARWMVAPCTRSDNGELPVLGLSASVTEAAAPDPHFFQVFAGCHATEAIDAHVRCFYVPALMASRLPARILSRHFVIFEAGEPVACATLHVEGRLAGLYNVGTLRSHQRRGIGEALARHVVDHAAALGCTHVFLQCAAGTHLERLYARAGFRTAFSPFLVCLDPD